MSSPALGRLKKVELRTAWASEPFGFTPWLATQENLQLLSEAIGIELELESQEKAVGRFSADILCKDTATGDWVVIENQLERTDHTHLGQLLTYAAGLNAVTIVWIAQRFNEEHRAALDWLNEGTDQKIRLFGLEIELWQIGDSLLAPKFNIVSKPNDWAKTVQEAAANAGLPKLKQLQLRFWTGFKEFIEEKPSPIRCQKPQPLHSTNHALGRSGIYLASIISTWDPEASTNDPEIRAEVYLDGPSAKQNFAALYAQKDAIEAATGFPLVWRNPENKAMCNISVRHKTDVTNPDLWPTQFEWLRQKQEKLHAVFAPMVKNLTS
ncbi:MAG: DUF4268 domain-containing protein [Bryobacteraceae bacterium]|nr:DUF4268 domain-containing protein [Bryobacteraceae bacterium]